MSSLKRVFDVSFCLLAAPMVVPLLACAALWIKLDSTGPVFFRHIRIGRDRKPFEILKLRTMIDRRAGEIRSTEREARNGCCRSAYHAGGQGAAGDEPR